MLIDRETLSPIRSAQECVITHPRAKTKQWSTVVGNAIDRAGGMPQFLKLIGFEPEQESTVRKWMRPLVPGFPKLNTLIEMFSVAFKRNPGQAFAFREELNCVLGNAPSDPATPAQFAAVITRCTARLHELSIGEIS